MFASSIIVCSVLNAPSLLIQQNNESFGVFFFSACVGGKKREGIDCACDYFCFDGFRAP